MTPESVATLVVSSVLAALVALITAYATARFSGRGARQLAAINLGLELERMRSDRFHQTQAEVAAKTYELAVQLRTALGHLLEGLTSTMEFPSNWEDLITKTWAHEREFKDYFRGRALYLGDDTERLCNALLATSSEVNSVVFQATPPMLIMGLVDDPDLEPSKKTPVALTRELDTHVAKLKKRLRQTIQTGEDALRKKPKKAS